MEAAAAERLVVSASILRKNWASDGKDIALTCGGFELDGVEASGPPATVNIKATSLPFGTIVRQTKKSKAWEKYNLSGIAGEIAGTGGMQLMYEAAAGTQYGSCRVSYVDPATGKCIERTAKADGSDAKTGQCLEISQG